MPVILNDLHFGLKRRAGVTPQSLLAFQKYQRDSLAKILEENPQETLIVLGDLFDGGSVDYQTLLTVHSLLRKHRGKLILVAGNHDLTRNQEQLSAFAFLCQMLPQAQAIFTPELIEEGTLAIIPHLPNQQLFDEAVAYMGERADVLLCHANYNNGFAAEKDHSLNLSPEQAALFDHVIIGHEHNKRSLEGIDILGSQYPTSISDCACSKGYHRWLGPGHDVEFVQTWDSDLYVEINWKELDRDWAYAEYQFIRVVGTATADEAAQVIDLVNTFRRESSAFFITNSVQVGSIELEALEDQTEEALSSFDSMKALMEILPAEHAERVRGYLTDEAEITRS